MGKYSDKEMKLSNGEKVAIKVNKSYEDGFDYYSPKGSGLAFDSLERVGEYLEKKIEDLEKLIKK